MSRFTGLLGIVVILAAGWLFSTHRSAIRPRVILWGVGLQFAVALLVLKTDFGKIFQAIGAGVSAMLNYAEAGSSFVFGPLGSKAGPFGIVFAFQVLPIVIFIASFFSILYYLGVMQVLVKAMAVVMQRVMGASGAESLNVAASIFMGQTEAPLTIKPFIAGMTQSELFTIMVSGMAHVSGAVMAAYVKIAGVEIRHLLTAVIMTAPATIMLAKMFMPEVDKPATAGRVDVQVEKTAVNVIDAAAQGAGDGLHLALNIAAMLIAFLALIAMINGILGWGRTLPGLWWLPISLQQIFAWLFAPVAWLLGVAWNDCATVGKLLGTRLVLNEFVAFLELAPLQGHLEPRSFTIATYALCGFANFSSIAIQIGGIGAIAPSRKSDLARLGLKAVAVGSMANFMSACIAGILV